MRQSRLQSALTERRASRARADLDGKRVAGEPTRDSVLRSDRVRGPLGQEQPKSIRVAMFALRRWMARKLAPPVRTEGSSP